MKYFEFINVKMLTFVGILIFMNRKNSVTGSPESEKTNPEFLAIFILMSLFNFHAQLS